MGINSRLPSSLGRSVQACCFKSILSDVSGKLGGVDLGLKLAHGYRSFCWIALSLVRDDERVRTHRRNEVAVSDDSPIRGHGDFRQMQQRDGPMSQIVRREQSGVAP